MRLFSALIAGSVMLGATGTAASAAGGAPEVAAVTPPVQVPPLQFSDGFAQLDDALGDAMGVPLEPPHVSSDGDVQQQTTTGLAYWRPDANVPVFSDGVTHYALTDAGLVTWTGDALDPPAPPPDPRSYLYAAYPDLAPRLDCVISRESGWQPGSTNPSSGAAGLAQFIGSTWRAVPDAVRQGRSAYDPYAAIDGAAWLAQAKGFSQWQVVQYGLC